jgi:hypothetical protein
VTSTVAQAIIDALPLTPGQALLAPAGGILVAALIAVLMLRLLVQVAAVRWSKRVVRILDIAAAPLLVGLVAILYVRFQEILPLG